MKKVAGRLRLDLSQYRELEAFAQFGAELDEQTAVARARRADGRDLNQPQYRAWPLEEQVVAIYAGTNGYLDDIPTSQVPRFQDELREHLQAEKTMYAAIRDGEGSPGRAGRAAQRRDRAVQGGCSTSRTAPAPLAAAE